MVKFTSIKQIPIEEFKTPFYFGMDKNNRWVRLTQQIPWDDLATIYSQTLCEDFGRPAKDARVVIGAMIIKHKKKLTDEETIEELKENPYLQYFIGYGEFSHKAPFDASLFVTLRERLGMEVFERMNEAFISTVETAERDDRKKLREDRKTDATERPEVHTRGKSKSKSKNKDDDRQGKLILDASVAPQDIRFPTDLDLLNDSREHTERIIDTLWTPETGKKKPLTYRKKARQSYLQLVHKKKKSTKEIRKGIRKQLGYLHRNIKTIKKMMNPELGKPVPLNAKDLRIFWIAQEIYRQQKEMYDNRIHRVSHRIVSINQPHVRPIVRGKSGKDVEFGAKLSASLVNRYVFLDHLSWDAYNEGLLLEPQVERYKQRFGYYPEVVIGDTIYGNQDNRRYLKKHGIRFSGRTLGRPPRLSDAEARLERKKRKQEAGFRNGIEGKFGEGKRRYDLGCVKAKTDKTSESWIAAVFFVMNLAAWYRKGSFLFFLSATTDLRKWFSNIKEILFNRKQLVFSW
jgi:ribosomal protein S10